MCLAVEFNLGATSANQIEFVTGDKESVKYAKEIQKILSE
jgi:hypothetical protein